MCGGDAATRLALAESSTQGKSNDRCQTHGPGMHYEPETPKLEREAMVNDQTPPKGTSHSVLPA
eukprot:1479255-Rhodomonas_salina.2